MTSSDTLFKRDLTGRLKELNFQGLNHNKSENTSITINILANHL